MVEEEGPTTKNAALDSINGPIDVEYASIDFSVLKRNRREGGQKPETTETVYAEINKKVKNDTDDNEENGKEESEMSEDKQEEAKHSVPVEEQGEDVAIYSNVKDMLGEI